MNGSGEGTAAGSFEHSVDDQAPLRGDAERPPSARWTWAAHLDHAVEYWKLAANGNRGVTPLAEREFQNAVDKIPPREEDHIVLLEVAARYGQLDSVKLLYLRHDEDWPFSQKLLSHISAIELAQAAGRHGPTRIKHVGDWLQFGQFVIGATDVLIWGAKKWLGPRGPVLVATALLGFMLYINYPFLLEMYRLWSAY